MLELASLGAKVLQIRWVEIAMKYGVPVHVRSSFNDDEGTWVVPEEKAMEEVLVAGVTATKDEAKVTLHGVPDKPGMQAKVLRPLADASIVVDMIMQADIQNGRTNLTFTLAGARSAARQGHPHQAVRRHLRRPSRSRPRRTSPRCRSSASACARTPAWR